MAFLSTKAIYGLAAMYTISQAPNERAMQVKEIAAMTHISHGYLEQLLSNLRKSNLLISIRGAQGGYKLAKNANQISVLEILEAVEGPFYKIEGNVGSSTILEYYWSDIEEKMCTLFETKLSELYRAYQPYFYEI
ncbi:MAG TPA: Rrf2 family transcriptional regulator [Arcobacter sp.]|nr:Rrf2 family transcriptional regulator [Arcobacter sp.]